jgi:cobalt-zinc-cadmium efflux system membrane fusion protein
MNRIWIACVATLVLSVAGCRRGSEPEPRHRAEAPEREGRAEGREEKGHEPAEHEALPTVVKLSPDVQKAAKVASAPASRKRLAATIELNGQVVPDPDRIALLGARVPGRVERVLVREGDAVRAGQVVAVVTSQDLAKLRATHAASSSRAGAARANAVRLRALAKDGLGSEQEAMTAEAEATGAEAERDLQAQGIRAAGTSLEPKGDPSLLEIVTPIAGQVVQRDAVPGQVVEPTHTVVTVADLSQVFFQAQLFEKDLAQLAEGAPAEVRLNGYPDVVFRARLARIASQIDPQARTLTARLVLLEPAPRVRLGLYGTARVSLQRDEDQEHVIVPLSAVTEIGDRKVVFVQHDDGDFQVHDVKLGPTAGGEVAVLSGIDAGERVVVSGVHTLKSAVLKSTMAEEE